MKVLSLRSSHVLVEWINILSEITQSKKIYNKAESNKHIKYFLRNVLNECREIDGEESEDKLDPTIPMVEGILKDQLKCQIPLDRQTMEHVVALVGAYTNLLLENYQGRYVYLLSVRPFQVDTKKKSSI